MSSTDKSLGSEVTPRIARDLRTNYFAAAVMLVVGWTVFNHLQAGFAEEL